MAEIIHDGSKTTTEKDENILLMYDNYTYDIELCMVPFDVMEQIDTIINGGYLHDFSNIVDTEYEEIVKLVKENKISLIDTTSMPEYNVKSFNMTSYVSSMANGGEVEQNIQVTEMSLSFDEINSASFSAKVKLASAVYGYSQGYSLQPYFLFVTFKGYTSKSLSSTNSNIKQLMYKVSIGDVKTKFGNGVTSYDMHLINNDMCSLTAEKMLLGGMSEITLMGGDKNYIFTMADKVKEYVTNRVKESLPESAYTSMFGENNASAMEFCFYGPSGKLLYTTDDAIKSAVDSGEKIDGYDTIEENFVMKEDAWWGNKNKRITQRYIKPFKLVNGKKVYYDELKQQVSTSVADIDNNIYGLYKQQAMREDKSMINSTQGNASTVKGTSIVSREDKSMFNKIGTNTINYYAEGRGIAIGDGNMNEFIKTVKNKDIVDFYNTALKENSNGYNRGVYTINVLKTDMKDSDEYVLKYNYTGKFKIDEKTSLDKLFNDLWLLGQNDESYILKLFPTNRLVGQYDGRCIYKTYISIQFVKSLMLSFFKEYRDSTKNNGKAISYNEYKNRYLQELQSKDYIKRAYMYKLNGMDVNVLGLKVEESQTWFANNAMPAINSENEKLDGKSTSDAIYQSLLASKDLITFYLDRYKDELKNIRNITDLYRALPDADKTFIMWKRIPFATMYGNGNNLETNLMDAKEELTNESNVATINEYILQNTIGWRNVMQSEFLSTAELKIVGDPFWIEFSALDRDKKMWLDPHVLLGISSGYEYNENNVYKKDTINSYLGPYLVKQIDSSFNNGVFTQTLHLFRPAFLDQSAMEQSVIEQRTNTSSILLPEKEG